MTLKPFDYLRERTDGKFEKAPPGERTPFVVAPLPANPEIDIADRVQSLVASIGTDRARHIEAMVAAYLTMTDVNPAEVVLIEERTMTGCRWWFERRSPEDAL